jgi:carbon starvation protein CstA
MVRHMPPVRNLAPGHEITYPNRDKASSKATKAIVVFIILVSVVLMLIVTIGGWSKLQGLKPVNIAWCLAYVLMAVYIARWNRGLLPIVSAFAILLLILAVIAGSGVAGTSWFDRNHIGFASPQTVFGGKGLSPDILGTITLLIAPVQVLLIFFAMRGFAQGWNVEVEAKKGESDGRDRRGSGPTEPEPAAA